MGCIPNFTSTQVIHEGTILLYVCDNFYLQPRSISTGLMFVLLRSYRYRVCENGVTNLSLLQLSPASVSSTPLNNQQENYENISVFIAMPNCIKFTRLRKCHTLVWTKWYYKKAMKKGELYIKPPLSFQSAWIINYCWSSTCKFNVIKTN